MENQPTPRRSPLARLPLYVKIAIALALGVVAGELLPLQWAGRFDVPARMILRVLGAIAPPLILVAVVRASITANARGRLAGKMFFLLALNTVVAILIGLLVANIVRPGRHASLPPGEVPHLQGNPLLQILDNIP